MGGADTGTPPAISCHVETERSKRSINIRGKIVSIAPVIGRYSFEVKKEGASGISNIQQSGNFSIAVGETALAGQTSVDFSRGTRIRVRLSGEGQNQKFNCDLDEISE